MEFRQALPVGSILVGDYRILDVLGQGGFGLTYKADDLRLGAQAAIKEYFPSDLALREEGRSTVVARSAREEELLAWGRAKFLDEARTLARFRHPNIVRVARLFEANNTAYMVLDFEMGPSLSQWRSGLGRTPTQAEIDRIAATLLDAVAVVHAEGILHRDIKPANVIMRDGTEPVLIDFGAARQALSAQSRTVHAIVTPGYSPKEQYAVDLDRQGSWSDIYALGATLYFLVTGKAPPDALSRDLDEPMPMAGGNAQHWRPGFLEAIDAAMTVRAEDRPQSVPEWRAMLLGKSPPTASRPQPRQPAASARLTAPAVSLAPPSGVIAGDNARGLTPSVRRVTFDDLPASQPASVPPRRSGGWGIVVTAVLAGLLALGGLWYWVQVLAPERDEAAWLQAERDRTIAAYDRYISAQPSGRHLGEARARRTALAQAATLAANATPPPSETARRPPSPETAPAPVPAPAPTSPPTPAASQDPTPTPAANSPPQTAPPSPPEVAANAAATPEPVSQSAPTQIAPQPVPPPAPTEPRSLTPRATLPAALSDAERRDLAANVAEASWRLAIGAFVGAAEPGYSEQIADFRKELTELTNGRLSFETLHASETPEPTSLASAVASQTGLMGWTIPIYESERDSAFRVFSGAVPFGLPPAQHIRWMRADGARLLEEAYAGIGQRLRAIPCGIAEGPGGWFRNEIRSPQDFRGLKVRAPALMVRAVEKLGAAAVNQSATSRIPALFAANQLDASLWYSPAASIFLQSPRPATTYHYPGVHSPSLLFALLVGEATWTAMSQAQQKLLDEACHRRSSAAAVSARSDQNDTLNRIRGQRITVRPFTRPVQEALQKAAEEVLSEESARNPSFRNALQSYNRFRR